MLGNCCQLLLTSTSCKILKHIITRHFSNFIEENGGIRQHQHGFRQGLSTTTQLLDVLYEWSSCLHKRGHTDVIFLDFYKAFHRVLHSKFLFKLNEILRNQQLISWLGAYLKERRQLVNIKTTTTEMLPVVSRVPQGFAVDPLLFIIFINDMCLGLNPVVKIKHFVDDTIIYT